MFKKSSKIQRIDINFEKDMKDVARERIKKGLIPRVDPQLTSMAEMTRLLRRTQGYQISLNELKTKPRKEDLV